MTRPEFCHQIFLKRAKFNPSSKSNDKLQIFLEFKSAHPIGIIFDGIRYGRIFSLSKDLFHNVLISPLLLHAQGIVVSKPQKFHDNHKKDYFEVLKFSLKKMRCRTPQSIARKGPTSYQFFLDN